MRLLSFALYYLSFILFAYAILIIIIKIVMLGSDFYNNITFESIAAVAGILLLYISKVLQPKTPQDEDGRTITKNL